MKYHVRVKFGQGGSHFLDADDFYKYYFERAVEKVPAVVQLILGLLLAHRG